MTKSAQLLTQTQIQGYQPTLKDWSVFGNAQPANKAFGEAFNHKFATLAGLHLVRSALLDTVGLVGKICLPFLHAAQGNGSQAAADLQNLIISVVRAPLALVSGIAAMTVGLVADPVRIFAETIRQAAVPGHRALTIIDMQNDFMPPKGSQAVQGADKLVKPINDLEKAAHAAGEYVAMTEDFHPKGHGSFASSHPKGKPCTMSKLNGVPQMLWPDHCIQGSNGVLVRKGLTDVVDVRVRKGQNRHVDSYSGFFDNDQRNLSGFFGWILSFLFSRPGATGLQGWFENRDVREIDLVGVATDYCVRYTAEDAIKSGLKVNLVVDACRGVAPDSTKAAVESLKNMGVRVITTAQAKAEYAQIKANKAAAPAA